MGSAPVVVPDVEMSSHEMRDDQEAGAAEGFAVSASRGSSKTRKKRRWRQKSRQEKKQKGKQSGAHKRRAPPG